MISYRYKQSELIHSFWLYVTFFMFLCLLCIQPHPAFAQYDNYRLIEPREGNEPQPLAILWSKDKASALVDYKGEHIKVTDKSRIDEEWVVKEIKRESILFGRTSNKKYIEYYIDSDSRPHKRYRTWSFYSSPITVWEASKMLTEGFEYNCIMHNLCSGAVSLKKNGTSFSDLLNAIITKNNYAKLEKNTLFILPTKLPFEGFKEILKRRKDFNYKALAMRFPGLEKEGTVKSEGYDIQYIMRVISLGGEVPIFFNKNLHFAVYANYKKVPFYKILSDIVYINQCIIVERESGLEIIKWKSDSSDEKEDIAEKKPILIPKKEDYVDIDPNNIDEKSGSGPYPPILSTNPRRAPKLTDEIVVEKKWDKNHPVVTQSFYSEE